LEEFQNLVKSPGWGRLHEILEQQTILRGNALLAQDIKSLEDAFEHSRLVGERRGILLAMKLPQTILDNLQEDIDSATSGS